MAENLSQRIVYFISKLSPLYMYEKVDDLDCARSVYDGTLISPVLDKEGADLDDELDWVKVSWQGDSSRSSIVHGTEIAHLAIVRYAEIHALPELPISITKNKFQHMAEHFNFKTGASLNLG